MGRRRRFDAIDRPSHGHGNQIGQTDPLDRGLPINRSKATRSACGDADGCA